MQYSPWETYGASFQSSMTLDAELPQEAMANHIKFTGKPGDILLFDTACWHTSMPNRARPGEGGGLDGASRCTVQVDYRSSETPYRGPRDFHWGAKAAISEPTLRRLAAQGKLPVSRRRLFGLPDHGVGDDAVNRMY